jgi:hypothetical protein
MVSKTQEAAATPRSHLHLRILRTPKEHGSIKAVLITEMAECLNRLPYQMRGFVLGLAWFGMVLFSGRRSRSRCRVLVAGCG